MKMKTFIGPTVTDVMRSVKKELGEEAVILSSRAVYTGGFLGLFRKRQIEVSAGIGLPEKKQAVPSDGLQQEIRELKAMVKELRNVPSSAVSFGRRLGFPEEVLAGFSHEQENGAEQQLQMEDFIRKKLDRLPMGDRNKGKKFMVLFGPTGVGKTTTIAKLAAKAVLEDKKRVGFITADTYRIAAIEQLKTYAALLQAPIEVVYSTEEFKRTAEQMKDLDVVFVDTAGRSFKEDHHIEELQNFVLASEDIGAYLVVSAGAKEQDVQRLIRNFSGFGLQQLILTKVDETESTVPVIGSLLESGLGVAYLTNGQEVPEDIQEASAGHIADLLFKEHAYG
ncbi:AAA family ATPase [Indiicoccus explosivorum]|uniref:AAA family ATPase n=1 Tax=Indiicoccus explosivorum TaxID=1917864 RepID=UPI000B4468C3|nr:AAA family ATPase [Indiicoccus explosivorum]